MRPLNPVFASRPVTIFQVMSALANEHGAINLGQGFPDEDGPREILDAAAREVVIDRLMAIEDEVDLDRVKWVCLLVMVNQPDAEEAFDHLEDLVYFQGGYLH